MTYAEARAFLADSARLSEAEQRARKEAIIDAFRVEVRLITATDLGDHPGPIRVIIPSEMLARSTASSAIPPAPPLPSAEERGHQDEAPR